MDLVPAMMQEQLFGDEMEELKAEALFAQAGAGLFKGPMDSSTCAR